MFWSRHFLSIIISHLSLVSHTWKIVSTLTSCSWIVKLHMHLVDLESLSSPSTLFLWQEKVLFELKVIDLFYFLFSWTKQISDTAIPYLIHLSFYLAVKYLWLDCLWCKFPNSLWRGKVLLQGRRWNCSCERLWKIQKWQQSSLFPNFEKQYHFWATD